MRRTLDQAGCGDRVFAETPGVVRTLPSADLEALLSVAPREVALLLPAKRLVFGRIVGRLRLQPWGLLTTEPIDLSAVVNASVANVREWQAVHRISDAQRRGLPITRAGMCTVLIEQPAERP